MKEYTYNNETHTLKEWCKIIRGTDEEQARERELLAFAEELEFEGGISNSNLYTLYTIWKGENCMDRASFLIRIAKTFEECRPELERYRSGKLRGWRHIRK